MIRALLTKYKQFLCFALIGVLNTFIHGGVLIISVERLLWTVTLSHLLAFSIANVFSYLMNSWLTFQVRFSLKGYLRFLVASLLSLGLTLLLAKLVDLYGAHYLVGFALIVVLVPLMSFLVMKFWVFSVRQTPPSA